MKKHIVILASLILTACGGGSGSSNTNNQTTSSGFYYSFDSTGSDIVDSSNNRNNATADALSRVAGKIGGAVKFQTEGSVIEAPDAAFPTEELLTLMAWVKTDVIFTDRQQIIGGWTGGAPGGFYPINNFGVSFINDKLSFEVSAYPNMLSVESNDLPYGIDDWFHVAITYNGSQIKFYFNGQLINEGSIITNFDSSFSNQIGHNYHVFSGVHIYDQFYGYLDELYLIDEVYTDQQILDYYISTN